MSSESLGYTVLQVSGTDAGAFLHAQLTRDIQHMQGDEHALAAWCDAKGRALCTLRVLATASGYLLILPTTLAATISKRLRMFVLRARVDITDVTATWTLAATLATADTAAMWPGNNQVSRVGSGYLLGSDPDRGPGALWLLPAGQASAALAPGDNAWQLAEIDAGLPQVTAATAGLFVPQMLNLHWLQAIDFDKGCYPGQEVIARLQFRGRLTRRLFRMHWQGPQPAPGDAVVDTDGKNQGTVVRTAQLSSAAGRLLAVLRVDAADTPLACGPTELTLLDLPYSTEPVTVD